MNRCWWGDEPVPPSRRRLRNYLWIYRVALIWATLTRPRRRRRRDG